MDSIIILVHILVALAIIGLILIQQGKGAEMGASFGAGASQTLFGASGSGNFFSKTTAVLAFVFFVSSFSLALIAKQNASIDEDFIPAAVEATPASVPASATAVPADDIPEVPEASDSATDLPEAPESLEASDLPQIPEGTSE